MCSPYGISCAYRYKLMFNSFQPKEHKKRTRKMLIFRVLLEAPTRFELVIEVLQTFALPLGYGAMPYVLLSITNT